MVIQVPQVDRRTAKEVAQQIRDLLTVYAPDWQERYTDTVTGETKTDYFGAALIEIFARLAEIIIQRLNQVPEKNFLAFLDLLGASLQPPQPARVPLTFTLAAGSTDTVVVPAGTQIAALPAEGEKEPVIFETEQELVVTPAQLVSVFTRDPEQDMYANHSAIIASPATPGIPVFQGNQRIEHILYIAHEPLLSLPHIKKLNLSFSLSADIQDADDRVLKWDLWDGTSWQEKTIGNDDDETQNLTQTGKVNFGATEPVPNSMVNSINSCWLRCLLTSAITRSSERVQNMVRESRLPLVKQVELEVRVQRPSSEGLLSDMSFTNSVQIEPGKDFYPLGEKPKLNDSLYLASAEAFSKDRAGNLASIGATISLDVAVANSHLLPVSAAVRPSEDAQLAWECWNGTTWQRVGTSTAPEWLCLIEIDPLPALTTSASVVVQGTIQRGAAVIFKLNNGAEQSVTAGEDGRFAVKAEQLSAGFNEIMFAARNNNGVMKAWVVVFKGTADALQTSQLSVTMPQLPVGTDTAQLTVTPTGESVKTIKVTNGRNDAWIVEQQKSSILQVHLAEGRNELLIEGLDGTNKIIAATTAMMSREAEKKPDPDATTGFADGTYALCQSGTVTLRLPDTVQKAVVNGQENYWLRTRLVNGDYGKDAAYKLKNPLTPEDGFTLVLANFRPPLVSDIKIGYDQTLRGVPEHCLAYNNLDYENATEDNKAGDRPYKPFKPAPEERPALYYGFTLPVANKPFPNRTVSLFNRVADRAYGERSVPWSPDFSCKSGDPESAVTHTFVITNPAVQQEMITIDILGATWITEVTQQSILMGPGETKEVQVTVAVPPAADVPQGSSDRGFVRLVSISNPSLEYHAVFTTWSGTEADTTERLKLVWEYWNGTRWKDISVRDYSENFTRPGLVEFLPPKDFTSHGEFGLERFWLRAQWETGKYPYAPRLQRALLNSTMAAQNVTIKNETLGSSDQRENQKFQTTRKPVLKGPKLELREPELPAADEQKKIKKDEGDDAISEITDAAGRPKEIWVRWHEVPDFYGSAPRDRHYVLDHLTGEIGFGNGLNGLIPPRGIGNIRMAYYQTGGGTKGNKPAGVITQLKTTVPYIEKVINTEAASGGADEETTSSLYERVPRSIRHNDRSVTVEDFEDLAMLATPEVARARCVPLRNLAADPLGDTVSPGEISVIIVPRTKDAKPLPTLELITRVLDHLKAHSIPTANVSVVGTLYLRVDITVEIVPVSLEGTSAVELAVRQTIERFLHPLTGGLDGKGWDFGREPYRSDLYALIEPIPGVDHIRSLKLDDTSEDADGAIKKTGRFLVYSGNHRISLKFEDQ